MKKVIIFILIIFSFSFVQFVNADIYLGDPGFLEAGKNCSPFFEEHVGSINPNDYKKIRKIEYEYKIHKTEESPPDKFGLTWTNILPETYTATSVSYCVNREEYCQKNFCDPDQTYLRFFGSISFNVKNIFINFFLNSIIIIIFYLIIKKNLKIFFNKLSIIKIGIITILGYLIDFIAITVSIHSTYFLCHKINNDFLCPPFWWDSSFYPLPSCLIITVLVLIFVAIVFFFVYSKLLAESKIKRIIYSIIFGILSNPIWYFFFLIFDEEIFNYILSYV